MQKRLLLPLLLIGYGTCAIFLTSRISAATKRTPTISPSILMESEEEEKDVIPNPIELIEEIEKETIENNQWILDIVKAFEKELNNFQNAEVGFLSTPTTLAIPRTHYLFDHNKGTYRTEEEKSEPYCQDDLFCNAFLRSVRAGAEMFEQMTMEVARHGEAYKQISPKSLDDILDLINFFVFAAIKKDRNKFKIRNLALNIIEVNKNNTNMLLGFFQAYEMIAQKRGKGLFQKSSHGDWFSIHLAEQEGGYRYLLYGLDAFKSIGIHKLNAYTLQIRPHTKKQGRPGNWNNHDNEINLDQEELRKAAQILPANKPYKAGALSEYVSEITADAENMLEHLVMGEKGKLSTKNEDEN
ncbi:MAG: hypothetical protein M1549_00765 [Candidatus Dependentiae bacterium]|nr:hypothetical protein [Candidatus Dependentiae bacterium]